MDKTANSEIENAAGKQSRRVRNFSRTYKACHLCRRKKTRCILDGTSEVCLRCRRERRRCVFPTYRSHRDEEAADYDASALPNSPEETLPMIRASTSNTAEGDKASPSTGIEQDRRTDRIPYSSALNGSHASPDVFAHVNGSFPVDIGSTTAPILHVASGYGRSPGRPDAVAAHEAGTDLASDIMRTLVANGNDALGLLFQAAAQSDASNFGNSPATNRHTHDTSVANMSAAGEPSVSSQHLPVPLAIFKVWDAFRFVKMGWFTSDEAVTYVDFFRRNLAPLSTISRDLDLSPNAHFKLITQEPLLCSVLLLIAAKYCILPGSGGIARSTLVHHRLWEHCHHLIMRIIFGQEKRSKAKTRTRGAVQALLLMVEWHPRAIHFPPGADGWDSSLLLTDFDPRDDQYGNRADTADELSARWQREVISPARTFDRMAWMLLGCAQSLALELGVCDMPATDPSAPQPPGRQSQQARLREMIYILVEQHSCRLGCPSSMVPGGFNRAFFDGAHVGTDRPITMTAWLDLTSLTRMINDVLFPSSSVIRELLKTCRYVNIIKHFQQQLETWRKTYIDANIGHSYAQQELRIEFHHTRALMNSLGVQAVVDRVVDSETHEQPESNLLHLSITGTDYDFIREVVDGSCQVLKLAVQLFEAGQLRYCPVRVFLHVITASVFLLKALSLGTRPADLDTSLQLLESCIAALKASSLDDMDLPARYSELLNLHLAKFRDGMAPASAPQNMQFADLPFDWEGNQIGDGLGNLAQPLDEWLALPFDPSFAPFGHWGGAPDAAGLDDAFSPVFWSLPNI